MVPTIRDRLLIGQLTQNSVTQILLLHVLMPRCCHNRPWAERAHDGAAGSHGIGPWHVGAAAAAMEAATGEAMLGGLARARQRKPSPAAASVDL